MAKVLIPFGAQDGLDLNRDGKVTIDELFQGTLRIYGFIVAAISAVLWSLWIAVAGQIPHPVTFLRIEGAILGLCVPIAAYIGIKRMRRYERQEARDQTMWELERKRAEWEFDQARGVSEDARSSSLAQAEIDVAAMQILQRYYQGQEWSRDACVGAGLMTADLWNEANDLLKKRRIRSGRKTALNFDTFQDAWARYCEAKLNANQHRVANGNWTEAR